MRVFKQWLPLAAAVTLLVGLAYVVGQQILRQNANDPQIQLAEDWANKIASGSEPNQLNLGDFIDPTQSLAPFGIVYDSTGNIATSSVTAPSTMRQPDGVFAVVDSSSNQERRFTWAPASGGRYAVVIKRTALQGKTYYVLAGRNLREVEARENQLLWMCGAAWLVTLAAVGLTQNTHVVHQVARRRKK